MNLSKISGCGVRHRRAWPKENGHWKLWKGFTRRAGTGGLRPNSRWRLAFGVWRLAFGVWIHYPKFANVNKKCYEDLK
jgi:hypothetical protein